MRLAQIDNLTVSLVECDSQAPYLFALSRELRFEVTDALVSVHAIENALGGSVS